MSEAKLATADILAFLEAPTAAEATDGSDGGSTPDLDELRGPYRSAAAVLAAIEAPESLRPVGKAGSVGQVETVLANELIPATGRRFHGRLMLDPSIRVETIRDLIKADGVEAALAANPDERVGPIQEQLESYLTGTAKPLDEQSLDQLDATLQVSAWLYGAVDGVPSEAEVQVRSAYRRLLEPFEAIAGDDRFRGRQSELDTLRTYVGVLPPASLIRRVHSAAFKWAEPQQMPALSLSGPGGVGKSALIARFMLEHTKIEESARIPFAYLDFDRVALDVGDPLGLIVEMIRQITLQYPGTDRFEMFQKYVNDPSMRASLDPGSLMERAESLLADLLGRMGQVLGPRPYVVVLDTFEEVQYRGETRAYPLWEMLDRLQRRAPFLRVVIAGRAPVTSLVLGGKPPLSLLLGELDAEAAAAFLKSQGVTDADVARQLVKAFGGVPLSLKLVATLLAQDPDALKGKNAPKGRGTWFVSLSDEVIQGQLYERVLDRIKDEQVRRLAYPGLVLRRITPEVILQVLNEPCELGLKTMDEAAALFEGLRREVSLVSIDATDGALVHRSDLRRVMLRLLMESEPIRVRQIRTAAIAFYDSEPSRRGVAEATYHRLALGQTVDPAILRDPEIRASIQTAIVEFSVATQLELSALGFEVTDEVRSQASREQRDSSVASQVEDMLPYGATSVADAQRLVDDASQGVTGPSPLYQAGARVAMQQDDLPRARTWISRGLEAAALANGGESTLGLVREQAWLDHGLATTEDDVSLQQLATYAERYQDRMAMAQHRLQALGPKDAPPDAVLSALSTIRDLLRGLGPEGVWNLAPATRRAVEASVALPDGGIVATVHDLVLSESSPFRYVSFPDQAVQAALEAVLGGDQDPARFAASWLRLMEMWPYRVLDVRPPLGRSAEQLNESAS